MGQKPLLLCHHLDDYPPVVLAVLRPGGVVAFAVDALVRCFVAWLRVFFGGMAVRAAISTAGFGSAHLGDVVESKARIALADLCVFAVSLGGFRSSLPYNLPCLDTGIRNVYVVEIDHNCIVRFPLLVLVQPEDPLDVFRALNEFRVGCV